MIYCTVVANDGADLVSWRVMAETPDGCETEARAYAERHGIDLDRIAWAIDEYKRFPRMDGVPMVSRRYSPRGVA